LDANGGWAIGPTDDARGCGGLRLHQRDDHPEQLADDAREGIDAFIAKRKLKPTVNSVCVDSGALLPRFCCKNRATIRHSPSS